AGEVEIPHRPAVGPAAGGLDLVDDLHGPDLGRPADRAHRQAHPQGIEGGAAGGEGAGDVAADVHDVAVALDRHAVVDDHAADLADPADVVAVQVDQHDVLGPLLGVGQQFLLQGQVLGVGPATA